LSAETRARTGLVRAELQAAGLDACVVRGTDRFLNEYVPRSDSTRTWLTGFDGSTGEAFLPAQEAQPGLLSVDGRYELQAEAQTAETAFEVNHVPLGQSVWANHCDQVAAWARAQPSPPRVGYPSQRCDEKALDVLRKALREAAVLIPCVESPVERARGAIDEPHGELRSVDPARGGGSVAEKLGRINEALTAAEVDALLVQRLDALAWLTGLRASELPYQATFRGVGLIRGEVVSLALPGGAERLPEGSDPGIEVVAELPLEAGLRVGYVRSATSVSWLDAIRAAGATPVAVPCPLSSLMATKTPGEFAAMRAAFAEADRVMEGAIAFVNQRVDAGERVTEADLAAKVEELFGARGAQGLSFKVIAAAGANGAHIHYSTPDPERAIEAGELVLLDMGGYFAEGYATDLTRTWVAGSHSQADPLQRERYTRVLQGAVAGMSARLPTGTSGQQLDALVRAPIWAGGYDYRHGTGHGVGVNVHEAPPRIGTRAGTPVEAGQVFSIEPGVYLEGWGGIRIENLCTLEPVSDAPGFLDMVPLTFAALDERLIDDTLLSTSERTWLERYAARRAEVLG
jgi:Xaa-Pro aminopeptidase